MFHQVPCVRAMRERLQREIGNDVADEYVQSKLLQFTMWVDEIHAREYEASEEESQRSTGEKEDDIVRVEKVNADRVMHEGKWNGLALVVAVAGRAFGSGVDTDVGRCSPGTRDAVSMVDPCGKQSGFSHESFLDVLILDDVVTVYADVAAEQLQSHSTDQAFRVGESVRGFVRGDTEMFDGDGSCWEMVNLVEETPPEQFPNHTVAEIPACESPLLGVDHHLNNIKPE